MPKAFDRDRAMRNLVENLKKSKEPGLKNSVRRFFNQDPAFKKATSRTLAVGNVAAERTATDTNKNTKIRARIATEQRKRRAKK